MERDAIIHWLLEEDNPPVRVLTLTRLLKRPDTDTAVQDAYLLPPLCSNIVFQQFVLPDIVEKHFGYIYAGMHIII